MLRSIKKKPKGILIFAILLIAGSLYKLFGFLNYDYYVFMFQQLPVGQIHDRYILSIVYRGVGIITACGLMYHQKWARQVFMLLCAVTLLTIYFKHPFYVFENIAIYFEQQKGINTFPAGTITDQFVYPLYPDDLGNYQLVYPMHPIFSFIAYCMVDVVFCGWALFYFSNKKIKQVFN